MYAIRICYTYMLHVYAHILRFGREKSSLRAIGTAARPSATQSGEASESKSGASTPTTVNTHTTY